MGANSLNNDDSTPLVPAPVSHKVYMWDNVIPITIILFYFVLSTILPIYTKDLSEYYHYPLSATTLQVAGALIALTVINAIVYIVQRRDLVPKSWIGNKHFLWKSIVTLPVSIIFAVIIALTNVSIFSSPLDLHVLLKATNIIWVVILAWIVQKEQPKIPVMICVAGLIVGTVLIGYQFSKGLKSPAKILFMNLFTFFCEAVMVVVMKKVVVVLQQREPTIRAHEITLTKLWQSFLLLLLPTYLIEGLRGVKAVSDDTHVIILVIAGIAITAAYQTISVGLTFFSLATTLGVLGQITIVPQTILAMLMVKSKDQFTFTPLHIVGAVLVLLFSVAFGILRYIENRKEYAKRKKFLVPTKSESYGTNFEGEYELQKNPVESS